MLTHNVKSESRDRLALSERETQLLQLATQGLTDQAIATKLGISLATVGTYWGRIRIKLGPLNRTELVANFLRDQASNAVDRLRHENSRLLAELHRHTAHERELEATLSLLRTLIESAPDALVIVDGDGLIRIANQEAARLFGYSQQELVNTQVSQLIPPRFRGAHDGHRRAYVAQPAKRAMGEHMATTALHRDGHEFPIAATLSANETPHGVLVTCIIRKVE